MKVTISSTTLPDWLDLRSFFYYMRINSEGIIQPSSFTIYDIKIQKIRLKNCVGNIVCVGNNDSNDLIFREKSLFEFQVSDEYIDVPGPSTCKTGNYYELIMMNVQICTTLKPQSNIVKIYLESVEVTDGCIVGIDEAFMSLTLVNCSGEFKISHALYNSEFMINLTGKDNFIKIERTLEGLYNITIKNVEISENITIPMNADTVQLTNITVSIRFFLIFSGMCNNLEVRNFSGGLKFPNVAAFKRFTGCRLNLRTDSSILSIPTRHYEWSDVNFSYNVPLFWRNHLSSIKRPSPNKAKTSPVHVIGESESSIFAGNGILVDITNLIRNITTERPLFLTNRDKLRIEKKSVNGSDKITIENVNLHDEWEIVKNTTGLRIVSVKSQVDNSKLHINDNTKSLYIEESNVAIGMSDNAQLEAITIKYSPFMENQKIFQSLNYLRLERMLISSTFDLMVNLKTLIINDVKIDESIVLKIHSAINYLSISKLKGSIILPEVTGCKHMLLHGIENIKQYKISELPNKYHLFLQNCIFKHDIELGDGCKTLEFRDITMEPSLKVILNAECESLKLNSCNINLDCSRAIHLEDLTLTKMPFCVKNGVLYSESIHSITFNESKVAKRVTCPNHVRKIFLHDIEVSGRNVFCINKNCEEVSLRGCSGKFDLSNITCLKKLVIVSLSNNQHRLQLRYPSFNTVKILELSYNPNKRCPIYPSVNCSNVEQLILHGIKYDENVVKKNCPDSKHREATESDFINDIKRISIFLNCKVTEKNLNAAKNLVKQHNIKVNQMFREYCTFSIQSQVSYLNLDCFNLDEESITMLGKFVNLQVFILSSFDIPETLFLHLPVNIETLNLKILETPYHITDQPITHYPETMKGLQEYRNLKNLVLNSSFLTLVNFSCYLPECLESLKLIFSSEDQIIKPIKNFKKICLRCFTVEFINKSDISSWEEDPVERSAARKAIVEQFTNFIEFEKLDELIFEQDGEIQILNKKIYIVK